MRNRLLRKLCLFLTCVFALLIAQHPLGAKTHPPVSSTHAPLKECEPTRADFLGPFYEPDAPVRSTVGKGYILAGTVRSSTNCGPISKARIEFWLTNSAGSYDDAHRATMFTDGAGEYRFESNFPPGYYGRPPHIHIRISAEGHKTLATQHYPSRGESTGRFDFVLEPLD